MSITKLTRSDLQFFPSERLSDYPDGGGLALGKPINGEVNELFNPISDLAMVTGDFSMRLVYAGVSRADDERLIGANLAITKPPTMDNVSYLLSPANFGELRAQGVSRVENYVTPSFESSLTLLSSPSKGSKVIQAYQRVNDQLPNIGDVFCLMQDKQGYPDVYQFIQVAKIESSERTFTEKDGSEFVRTVIKMEITQPLAYEFIGADYPSRYYLDNPCKIRETTVSDSARFFGVKPLAQAVRAGSMTIQIPSLMEKIVPTAMTETPMLDKMPFSVAGSQFELGHTVRLSIYKTGDVFYIPPFVSGSFRANTNVGNCQDVDGKILINDQQVGTVDYRTGVINFNKYYQLYDVSFVPMTVGGGTPNSHAIFINHANRGYAYTLTIPNIGAGSLVVSYMAQGNWYQLYDNGLGQLIAPNSAQGTGTVNYRTGTISVTCGEMPDDGTAVMFFWSSGAGVHHLGSKPLTPTMQFQLSNRPSGRHMTVRLSNATASVVNGKLTGSLVGDYHANTGILTIVADINKGGNWQNAYYEAKRTGSGLTVTYPQGNPTKKEIKNVTANDGNITIKLSDNAIFAGSVYLVAHLVLSDHDKQQFAVLGVPIQSSDESMMVQLHDDGQGRLFDNNNLLAGTIDYQAGSVTIKSDYQVEILAPSIKTENYTVSGDTNNGAYGAITRNKFVVKEVHQRHFIYGYEPKTATGSIAGSVIVASYYDNQASNSVTETIDLGAITIPLGLPKNAKLMANSVWLTAGNMGTLYDKDGFVYQNHDPQTGQGVVVGEVNYSKGAVILRQWGGNFDASLYSGLYAQGATPMDEMHFHAPTRPIRPTSLQLYGTLVDGQSFRVTANQNGEINGEWVQGVIDHTSGIAHLRFGKLVNVVGNENKPWFDANQVVGDKIWQPAYAVDVRYNAIAVQELPIDNTIIKVDTVRLPNDGRVPIYRVGDIVLIGNRVITEIGSSFSGGQMIRLPRQNLDRICVKDNNNKHLDANLYDYDLEHGTIVFSQTLDLSGYQMPLWAMHATEEKNRITDVNIDGTLTLLFGLKNGYEKENTYVSSVMAQGDMQVRSSVPFTQKNWNNKWSDEPVGDPLLNRLNTKDYPIILTDDGAIKERWLIKFTSSTEYDVYGETLGFVTRGTTNITLAPVNPSTGKPYFSLDYRAFGATGNAWASQDVIRFNTEGTLMPFWVIRAVSPSQTKQVGNDGFVMCLFGDTTEV